MQLGVSNEPYSRNGNSVQARFRKNCPSSVKGWSFRHLAIILKEIWIIVQSEFRSSPDRQTDGQKVMHMTMSPTYNMHRWAQKGKLYNKYFIITLSFQIALHWCRTEVSLNTCTGILLKTLTTRLTSRPVWWQVGSILATAYPHK